MMGKIRFDNVRFVAKNGGSIKNHDDIEITNSSMNFEQNGIDFSLDEPFAIIEKLAELGYKNQISELITTLKKAKPEEREKIVKESFLTKALTGVKNIKPLVDMLFQFKEING